MLNRRVTLRARPEGIPGPEHFDCDALPIPPLGTGELLVETTHISIDPAMRSWITASSGYARGVAIISSTATNVASGITHDRDRERVERAPG